MDEIMERMLGILQIFLPHLVMLHSLDLNIKWLTKAINAAQITNAVNFLNQIIVSIRVGVFSIE